MKQKRYWLRGGVVGLIIGILIVLYIQFTAQPSGYVAELPFKYMWLPLLITFGGPTVGGFAVGSLCGWIYGKIKNKSRVVSQ